jgi:hypothetical protein
VGGGFEAPKVEDDDDDLSDRFRSHEQITPSRPAEYLCCRETLVRGGFDSDHEEDGARERSVSMVKLKREDNTGDRSQDRVVIIDF